MSCLFFLFSSGIPHFKDVVIMATNCDYCGHKTNEVKSGTGIEPKGTKITLKVTDVSDLSRDVLKVTNCTIP
jgi:zinc finger protein